MYPNKPMDVPPAATGKLLRSQRFRRVHTSGAASREVARERGRRDESECRRSIGRRVDGSHSE